MLSPHCQVQGGGARRHGGARLPSEIEDAETSIKRYPCLRTVLLPMSPAIRCLYNHTFMPRSMLLVLLAVTSMAPQSAPRQVSLIVTNGVVVTVDGAGRVL